MLAQAGPLLLVELRQVGADGSHPKVERLPPFVERGVIDIHREHGLLDLLEPGFPEELGEMAFARAGQSGLVARPPDRAPGRPPRIGSAPPRRRRRRPTRTPRRHRRVGVTRAISPSPPIGDAMKCTTSWASAASKPPSANGSRSAAARLSEPL